MMHPSVTNYQNQTERSSASVQVSRTPASQNHPRAPATGVREAPRHEIASRKALGFAAAIYGDLRRASVCFREAGTKDALDFGGLIGRGERESPALGSCLAGRRRSQDVGAASSSERRRRWLTVSRKNGKNGKNGWRCVAVDNAISIMRYRSRSRGARWPAGTSARSPSRTSR
jgi:hypothetical protein